MKNLSSPLKLIRESINIFFKKENLIYFLKIYAVLIPFIFASYIFDLYTNLGSNLDITSLYQGFGLSTLFLIFVPIVALAYLVVSFWVNAAGIIAVSGVLAGNKGEVREVFLIAWKKLWKYSLLSILVGLVVGFGFLLLIIPGIIFLVWYYFSGFEFMTKETGIGAAMGASKKLISGRFFPILGRFIVFGLFGMLVQIIFSIIPWGIGSAISPIFGAFFIIPYFLLYKELSSQ